MEGNTSGDQTWPGAKGVRGLVRSSPARHRYTEQLQGMSCKLKTFVARRLLRLGQWPTIPGLKDKFKGKVVHTARWDKDYQAEQWKNDRVAVIGSGASSIQTVPTMQPHVKHLDIFVRTAVWFVQIANNFGQNHVYEDDDKMKFKKDPKALVAHAKDIEDQVSW